MSYPGQVLTFFVIPWGSRIWFSSPVFLLYRFSLRMFSCSYFILLCYRIFSSGFWSSVSSDDCQVNQLKQKLKLTLFASRASGKSENYLTTSTMGRVHQGRVGRSRFSCRSYGLCRLPAVSSTVFKVGVCH